MDYSVSFLNKGHWLYSDSSHLLIYNINVKYYLSRFFILLFLSNEIVRYIIWRSSFPCLNPSNEKHLHPMSKCGTWLQLLASASCCSDPQANVKAQVTGSLSSMQETCVDVALSLAKPWPLQACGEVS